MQRVGSYGLPRGTRIDRALNHQIQQQVGRKARLELRQPRPPGGRREPPRILRARPPLGRQPPHEFAKADHAAPCRLFARDGHVPHDAAPPELPLDHPREQLVRPSAGARPPRDPVTVRHHRRGVSVPQEPVLLPQPRDHLGRTPGPGRVDVIRHEHLPYGLAQHVAQGPRPTEPPRRLRPALGRLHRATPPAPVDVRQLPGTPAQDEGRVAATGLGSLEERRVHGPELLLGEAHGDGTRH